MSGTAFGKQVGKFIVGSPMGTEGLEMALSPKFIGEEPSVSLSQFDIRLPERVSLGATPLQGFIVGAIVGAIIEKLMK